MEPITPQMKKEAFREHQANQAKAIKAGGWLLEDAYVDAAQDPEHKTGHFARAKRARSENTREIDTAYAVKSGATMGELAAKGTDIEVSGDALRRAKAGKPAKIITQLPLPK